MNHTNPSMARRDLLRLAGVSAIALSFAPKQLLAASKAMHTRAIPRSGEKIAIMGMGTSRTFDVGDDSESVDRLADVVRIFFNEGGQLIDTSPMYGTAESVLGKTLQRLNGVKELFVATKVWTDGKSAGEAQMRRSAELLGVKTVDLMQIHNLRDWRTHLATLREWKEQGKIRYIGVTTSHGRFHDELKRLLKTEPFDFVQFSYNIVDRGVEKDLLPLAQDKGIATLINRPFLRGDVFSQVKGKPLPEWAAEIDCESWGQFFLKFVAGHPAVTCLIPATSKQKHMLDNMKAGYGALPDPRLREKMAAYVAGL